MDLVRSRFGTGACPRSSRPGKDLDIGRDFWNLGTITISRVLQERPSCPSVVTSIPIYKDGVGLVRPRGRFCDPLLSEQGRSLRCPSDLLSTIPWNGEATTVPVPMDLPGLSLAPANPVVNAPNFWKFCTAPSYRSLESSTFASLYAGTSGSASFHRARNA